MVDDKIWMCLNVHLIIKLHDIVHATIRWVNQPQTTTVGRGQKTWTQTGKCMLLMHLTQLPMSPEKQPPHLLLLRWHSDHRIPVILRHYSEMLLRHFNMQTVTGAHTVTMLMLRMVSVLIIVILMDTRLVSSIVDSSFQLLCIAFFLFIGIRCYRFEFSINKTLIMIVYGQ